VVNKIYIYIYIVVGVPFLIVSYHGLIIVAPNKILNIPIIIILRNQTFMDDKTTNINDRCCDKKSNEAKKNNFGKKALECLFYFLQNLYRYKFGITFL
jgi:hypothetical protein